nr:SufE family protein [Aliarcobacter cryaerophilus]
MSIEKRLENIKEDLDFFDEELAKYEYIIDLGKKLPAFDEKNQIPENLVHGCTSQVWLICEKKTINYFFMEQVMQ